MPITKRQFELKMTQEVEGYMRQIYDFLASHKDSAYSLKELREVVLGKNQFLSPTQGSKFNRALEILVEIGAFEVRVIVGDLYYAFLREHDTRTWELGTSGTRSF